jgi:signal transduction histidine kinase
MEIVRPQELLEEALRVSADGLERRRVSVVRRYEELPATTLDRQRVLQILVNLIGNAVQAMEDAPEPERELTLTTMLAQSDDGELLRIGVSDRGEGIAPHNLERIFAHGFTTRKHGHGFGLHSSALAAVEMGGRITVHSDGLGRGAVFTLELPVRPQ